MRGPAWWIVVKNFARLNVFSITALCQSGSNIPNYRKSSIDQAQLHASSASKQKTIRCSTLLGSLVLLLLSQAPVRMFGATPGLSKVSCGANTVSGSLTKACSVYLTSAATSKVVVNLSSNNSAVSVQSTVTVNPGATTAGFSLKISAVTTAQSAGVTGSLSGVSSTYTLYLNPVTNAGLTLGASSLSFGNVAVGSSAAQNVTLTSSGTGPLTISSASVSGAGFSVSGVTFPVTLNAGQSVTLSAKYAPTYAGAAAATLTVTSNSSTSPSAAIGLSGAGLATMSALSCGSSSIVAPASVACTVNLNATAPTGGQLVSLSSTNAAITVPSSINIAAGTSSIGFAANVSAVTSNQAATLSASANAVSKSFSLQAMPSVSTLTYSTTSLGFGSVSLNKTASQFVTLSSTGTAAVTVSAASVSGAGFTLSGAALPVTLNPGNTLTLGVVFAPTTTGTATGQLTIASNSSTGNSALISLSGTGANATSSTSAVYYLAPASLNGKDSNNGLSISTPWLSPNHSLNCGDVIIALASTQYDSTNFNTGHWGTVSCPSGNNVAWLQCETFDGCKITTNIEGMYVDHSYWGVQGWEVSIVGGQNGFCFGAAPKFSSPANIHHIIFANNIANGCKGGGFVTFNVGTTGTDYFTVVGNIVYNAIQGNDQCYSGISLYQPVQSDWTPGTHLYIAGNFSWGNFQPNPCAGIQPWGGDGLIFDTLDGSQGGMPSPYTAQAVAENNIFIGNGGYGIEVQNNVAGSAHAPIFLTQNTVWGNEGNSAMPSSLLCAEVLLNEAYNVQETMNLVATKGPTACVSNPEYAISAYMVDGTDKSSSNFAFGYNNHNTWVWDGPGFSYDSSNITGQDPKFANPYVPGAPACGGAGNVPGCMASVINNFTPTNSAALSSGYQKAGSTPVSDPLFPQWLCNAHLPTGLTPMACPAL